jgi:hypothetical protein
VATSCAVVPSGTDGDAGEIVMAVSAAAVTVRVSDCVVPEIGSTTLMVVVPWDSAATRPCDPVALDTVATPGAEELQVTSEVTSRVVPSLSVPVAVSCALVASGTAGEAGARAIDWRDAELTVSVVVPAFFVVGSVAVTVVLPPPTAVAMPVLEIVATVEVEAVQVTWLVTSSVVPSV